MPSTVGTSGWIRVGMEVIVPSGRVARVDGQSADGVLYLTYTDTGESVRLQQRLVAPRHAEPVRLDRRPAMTATEIRTCGLPRPGKG